MAQPILNTGGHSELVYPPSWTITGRLFRCVWRPRLTLWILATVLACAVLQAWVFYSTTFTLTTFGRLVIVFHQGERATGFPLPENLGRAADFVLACWNGYFGYSPLSPGIGIVAYWLIPAWCSERRGVPQVRTAQSLLAEVPLDFTARIRVRALILGAPLVLLATTAAEFVSVLVRSQWVERSSFFQLFLAAVIWRLLAASSAFQGAVIAGIGRAWLFWLARLIVFVAPFLTYRIADTLFEVPLGRGIAMVILQSLVALILLSVARVAVEKGNH